MIKLIESLIIFFLILEVRLIIFFVFNIMIFFENLLLLVLMLFVGKVFYRCLVNVCKYNGKCVNGVC